jgi:hypothetical protein
MHVDRAIEDFEIAVADFFHQLLARAHVPLRERTWCRCLTSSVERKVSAARTIPALELGCAMAVSRHRHNAANVPTQRMNMMEEAFTLRSPLCEPHFRRLPAIEVQFLFFVMWPGHLWGALPTKAIIPVLSASERHIARGTPSRASSRQLVQSSLYAFSPACNSASLKGTPQPPMPQYSSDSSPDIAGDTPQRSD